MFVKLIERFPVCPVLDRPPGVFRGVPGPISFFNVKHPRPVFLCNPTGQIARACVVFEVGGRQPWNILAVSDYFFPQRTTICLIPVYRCTASSLPGPPRLLRHQCYHGGIQDGQVVHALIARSYRQASPANQGRSPFLIVRSVADRLQG